MTKPRLYVEPTELDASADLQTVLEAWHTATVRLEQTHESLRAEVQRLTSELECKNRELARKNRLADLGQMASHIAHEVRNALVPVTLYNSLLRRRVGHDNESRELLDKLSAGFTALDATVNDLLHFTAERDPNWQVVFVRKLVSDVLASLAPQIEAQGIRVDLEIAATQMLAVDADMLRRALLNLVLNALDVMPSGGELLISSHQSSNGFELEVADSGPGLPEGAGRRLFEPFYSTKSNGTGLGLAIVARIAEVHGGTVSCANCPQGGAAFTLRIPRPVQEAAA
jgi:signal transduction histidine kinase